MVGVVACGCEHQLLSKLLVGIRVSESPIDKEMILVAGITSQRLQLLFPLKKSWPHESYGVILIAYNSYME